MVLGRAAKHSATPDEHAVFLGRMPDGVHVWAVRGALEPPEDPHAETEVLDLRRAGLVFDDTSYSARRHRHRAAELARERTFQRPSTAHPPRVHKAGWARVDPVTGREEFPRWTPR